MADFLAVGRQGVAVVEDVPNATAYFQAGPMGAVDATAAIALVALDCGKVIHNKSAAGDPATRAVSLPPAAAGLYFPVFVHNAAGLRLIAAAGDKITIGQSSKIAGYVQSVKGWVCLYAIDDTEWVPLYGWGGDWIIETA